MTNSLTFRLPEVFPNLAPEKILLLEKYFSLIIKFNDKLNLVSPKTISDMDMLHFADSIFSSKIVHKNTNKNNIIVDVGSGNGFPGLVYSILNNEQKVILLDSDQRKCEFLKHVVSILDLTNVDVINKDFNFFHKNNPELTNYMCRGFAPLNKAEKIFTDLLLGSKVYYLKSDDWKNEIHDISSSSRIWNYLELEKYTIPYIDRSMCVVVAEKIL